MNLLTAAAQAVVSTQGTVVFCLGIAAFGLYHAFRFNRSTARLGRQLDDLTASLDGVSSARLFRERLEDVATLLGAHPLGGPGWREFRDSFIYPPDEAWPIRTSRSASEFFSFQALGSRAINMRFYAAVPGIMTGLGILGTFVGLVAGIHLASNGLQGSPEAAKTALSQLLSGASLAFLTSIAGLLLALPISLFEKHELHRLESRFEAFAASLDALVDNVTLEQLAQEEIEILERQARQLERFNTDFAVSVAQALDTRLSQSVAPILNQIAGALESLRAKEANTQESVVKQFQDTLSGATSTQMRELAGTLESLNGSLAATASALDTSRADFREASIALVDALRASVTEVAKDLNAETMASVTSMQSSLKEAGERLTQTLQAASDGTSSALGSVATRLQDSTVGLVDALHASDRLAADQAATAMAFGSAINDLQRAQTDLAAFAQPIARALEEIKEATRQLAAGAASGRAASDQMRVAATAVETTHQQMTKTWGTYQQRFEHLDASLAKTHQGIVSNLNAYTETMHEFLGGVDEKLGAAISKFSGAIQELAETIDDLPRPR